MGANSPVYFLTGATVALLVEDTDKSTMAVGLLGAEGVVGMAGLLNLQPDHLKFEVQTPGMALRAECAALRELMNGSPDMLWLISTYLWQLVEHVAQITSGIQTHDILGRLAAWLLLSADKAQSQSLYLTHEHLAHMLGVRRVSITLAASELRERGLLHYSRGRLQIMDSAGLEKIALAH